MKDGLASKEKNIEKLKDEISKVVQEKEKEVKSALESMTKLEAEVASEKKKVEMAELKLASSMEEHRYKSTVKILTNVKISFKLI